VAAQSVAAAVTTNVVQGYARARCCPLLEGISNTTEKLLPQRHNGSHATASSSSQKTAAAFAFTAQDSFVHFHKLTKQEKNSRLRNCYYLL